ncbi:unnamed protein product [Linum tenue]|uniref:Uncharacterized protein n=1 Tax=Linum tenue TaxID=586396 RepID=A0AAV0JZ77_9ROSI|nr:unnamed protein product [Linum tenue]
MAAVVSIIKTDRVLPKKSLLPPKIITLSNLDRQCPTHMYLILFYKQPAAAADHHHLQRADLQDSVYGGLKSGLEETLEAWYPAAGRLCVDPEDGNRLNLWCNNEGGVLVEAVTEVKISELGDDLSQYDEFLEKLVYKPVFDVDCLSQMPLLVAQVTRFGCGGYSIGIGTSHSLFDGPSTFRFLSAWASAAAAASPPSSTQPMSSGSSIVDHDRRSLTSLGCVDYNGEKRTKAADAAAIDHLYRLIHQQQAAAAAAKGDDDDDQKNGGSLVLKTYHLGSAMIDKLRRNNVFGGISSFEIVAAHLWKARTKALLGPNNKTTMVCLQFAVDIRNKLSPPLPAGFTGNAFVLASVATTAGELQQSTHQAVVDRIRLAKASITPAYVESYMAALDRQHGNSSLPPLRELTLVSDWTRMPFHKLRFLGGDRDVDCACPLLTPVPQVAYFMQSPVDAKGIDVRIGVPAGDVEAFTADFMAAMV